MTVEDDRIEHAARAAWETFSVEVGHDSELWRHQNPERQERWRKIARAVLQYVEPTEEIKRLESQLAGLRRAYDHERLQAEKYMRRTVEWRDAALNGTAVTVACTGCANGCEGCIDAVLRIRVVLATVRPQPRRPSPAEHGVRDAAAELVASRELSR